jgi:hypothetical protein
VKQKSGEYSIVTTGEDYSAIDTKNDKLNVTRDVLVNAARPEGSIFQGYEQGNRVKKCVTRG